MISVQTYFFSSQVKNSAHLGTKWFNKKVLYLSLGYSVTDVSRCQYRFDARVRIDFRCHRVTMPTLPSVTEGASGTSPMPPMLADSQSMLVDGGRCSRRQPRNWPIPRLIPGLPTYFSLIFSTFSLKFQLFLGWQPCRTEELAEELADSSGNIVNIGYHRFHRLILTQHRLPFYHRIQIL